MNKRLAFEIRLFQHKWPVFAVGFISDWTEFVIVLWVVEARINWRY